MTINTQRALTTDLMIMVLHNIKGLRRVTLTTQLVVRRFHFPTVGVVAITAGHTGLVHFTLQKRTPVSYTHLTLPTTPYV